MIEICSKNGLKRLISPTSFFVFSDNSSYSYNPINFFAATKQAFSDLVLPLAKNNNFAFDEVVIYDTILVNDSRKKIVSLILNAIETGEQLSMSPGNQILDLTDIETLAKGISKFIEDDFKTRVGKKSLYFASSGNRLTLRDLVNKCEIISNKKIHIKWGDLPYRNFEILDPIKPINNMNICDQENIDLVLERLIKKIK